MIIISIPLSFQHLALIKKGLRHLSLRVFLRWFTFQHLALIKKGLRLPCGIMISWIESFSTLP